MKLIILISHNYNLINLVMRGVRILGQNWEIPYVFYGDGVNDYKFE